MHKGHSGCMKRSDGSAGVQNSQCFLNLTNDNANVPVVTGMVRDHFHDNSLIVITKRSSHSRQLGYTSGRMRNFICLLLSNASVIEIAH